MKQNCTDSKWFVSLRVLLVIGNRAGFHKVVQVGRSGLHLLLEAGLDKRSPGRTAPTQAKGESGGVVVMASDGFQMVQE